MDVQLLHQRFRGHPGDLRMFGFPFFAIFASRLSSIPFTRSLRTRLLILAHLTISLDLADVADILVADSIPQSVANDAP